jgi:hypothetical protein
VADRAAGPPLPWRPGLIPAGLIIVDEAYVEFTDDPDATTCPPLVASGRVAVLRTFANHASCVGVSQPTTSAPTPRHTIRVLADSEPSPYQ